MPLSQLRGVPDGSKIKTPVALTQDTKAEGIGETVSAF